MSKREKGIVVRATEDERARLHAGAERDALPLGSWLRALGFMRLEEQRKLDARESD